MPLNSAQRRAVLIGTESLLTECGELLLARGHSLAAVVTQSHAIRHWADERGIPVLEQPRDLVGFTGLGTIDWLFSITYLSVLPAEVLVLPRQIALNFHDGPLPAYVGLNTPAWALINQEPAHGITWHRMTAVVDAGAVLTSRALPLAPDETSLTINARCFTAALESFGDVVGMLEQDQIDGSPQSGSGRTYRRADRPDGAQSIRWSESAETISALVRALDFGPYTNPLGLATTQYGGASITLAAVEVQPTRSGSAPGTVLPGAPDDLRIATGGNDLRITRMRVNDGQLVSGAEGARAAGIQSGGRFDEASDAARAAWRDANRLTAKYEGYWVRQLVAARPTALPVVKGKTETFPVPVRFTLDLPNLLRQGAPAALAAAATALAEVLDRPVLEGRLIHHGNRAQLGAAAPWFASSVPLRLSRLGGETPAEFAARNGTVVSEAVKRIGFAHDVALRYPELKGTAANAVTPLAFSIVPAAEAGLVPGSLLTLWTSPEGGESAWFADSDRLAIAEVEQWVSSVSRLLREPAAGAERVVAVRDLTPMQLNLLRTTAKTEAPATVQIVARFTEGLVPTRWQVALEQLSTVHDALRTRIRGEIAEVLASVTIAQTEMDWRDRSTDEQQASLRRFQLQDRSRGFDLGQAPLTRLTRIQTGDQDCWIVWTASALVLDLESMQQLWKELQELYAGETPATVAAVAALNHWVDGRDSRRDQTFWRPRLNDVTAPTGLPGDEQRSTSGELSAERTLDSATSDRLRQLGSLGTVAAAAWSIVLSRSASTDDVVFGVSQSLRRGSLPKGGALIGQVRTLLPLRVRFAPGATGASLIQQVSDDTHAMQGHALAPLTELQALSAVPVAQVLFESVVVAHAAQAGFHEAHESSGLPLTLAVQDGATVRLTLTADARRFRQETLERLLNQVDTILGRLGGSAATRIDEISLLDERERQTLLESWNQTACPYPAEARVHDLIAAQTAKTPDRVAVVAGSASLTYRQLDERANQLARHLATLGVGPDVRVGLALSRTPDLLVGLIGIHKAGGAYVPLDPGYPADRLEYMLTDSGAKALVTETASAGALPADRVPTVLLDQLPTSLDASPFDGGASSENLAYTIYTSGSTGKPKGVMVEHRNVANFFIGMDQRLGTEPGTWLAVTSPSFDISVLELCWTLARGFTVVLAATDQPAALVPVKRAGSTRPVAFSLYYFASGESNEGDKYRLLLEGAKFADEHGFEAVWTPERHFHAFGGLYPSPAVASAALAAITSRVKIRAGSVVLPLHHPIRVAEEWALVDNISKGRVGISFASGWQPNDFVLRPEAFSKQKEIMMRDIDVVRRLWRGETIPFPGAQGKDVPVRTLPRPVQPELPFWITTAGNPESFAAAGKAGAGVLTHLLGQSVEELGPKLESYRAAWKAAGHEGEGRVSLMLHAFVGEDPEFVRETVRGPMVEYLRSSVSLIKHYAWAFPTFRNAPKTGDGGVDLTTLSEDELNALLEHAFDRYYKTSGLFGTPEACMAIVDQVRSIGVDEIACLIDFGVPTETTLEHLPLLDQVRRLATADPAEDRSLAAELRRHQVTHLLCTPVLARLLAASSEAHEGLRGLKRMMVGGEAFPAALSESLRKTVGGEIHNMYGPTETTIWSTTHKVAVAGNVPLGAPIANTRVYVLDNVLQPVPIGVPGELCIGGAGVTRGYLGRPELTAERFVRDPFVNEKDARMYRTGDLVRWRPDGALEFLGRLDHQVKVRGFRIELGEIEAALRASDLVADTVVVVREDGEDKRIVAYVVVKQGMPQDAGRLRDALRAGLPEYMVPGAFVFMEALPLTLNGKVDRKQLPDPATVSGTRSGGGGAPTSALEQSIAAIWKDVLQTGTVGLDDNFFDIGGHSLLAVQAHRRMREGLNKDMPITALFQYPTVRMLAAHLDNGSGASATVQASVDRAEGRRAAMARRVASRRGEGN